MVLFIIGISAGLIVLSIGGGEAARQTAREAQRLAALLRLAREQAVLNSQELAVSFRPDGYSFLTLNNDKWQPLTGDDVLRARSLPKPLRITLQVDGTPIDLLNKDNLDKPHVFVLSSGETSTFAALFERSDDPTRYRVVGTAAKITVDGPLKSP